MDLKRIETPHSLCCDFWGYKTFTTRWSGGTVQVWVQVRAPACHLAISPKAVPEGNQRFRRQNQLSSSWGSSPVLPSYGWLVSYTVDECLQTKIAQKNLQIKNWSSSCQRWSLHGFQTSHFICYLFGCKLWLLSIKNYAWHCFQAFALLHLKSMCCSIQLWADALSLDRSLIQTCCFAQDSIGNMWFCSYAIFLLTDEWMVERLSEAMGAALVGNNFSPIPWKFHFTWKKKVTARNLQSIKTLLALELTRSQYRKSGSMFSSSEPVAALSYCCRLWNALCLCSPVWPPQAEQESCPKSLAVDFAV